MNRQTTILQTQDEQLIQLLAKNHLIDEIGEGNYSLETEFTTEREYYTFLNEIRANHIITRLECQKEDI